jgi:AcrR family transcriptional regulator
MGCSVKRQETTERIIQAAMAVFSREGFNGARVDEIAREAG